ncbi:hypothetical protein CALVIDRAFT_596369 [Calocera viscosa TUFC12733]|uniref:Fungal-type protein kinase domain-containing protein n=1 Tax=Calocera viscosa (strain TUFC12733) TaxID=1330018 RepID=A0A167PFF1_CALVF|nr:hypothetical protein CALVIDRAFT_596369 [Calocera viscosa TUFC12733]
MEGTTPSTPTTPPRRTDRSSTSNVQETPVRQRTTDSELYQSGTLAERRQLVAAALGSIRQYPAIRWWERVLPQWPKAAPDHLVDGVYAELVQTGVYSERDQRWMWFPAEPARDQRHETAVHKDWKRVVDDIVKVLHRVFPDCRAGTVGLEYWQQPSLTPDSQVKNLTRPDSYIIRPAKTATTEPDVPEGTSATEETDASTLGVIKKLANPKHSGTDIGEVGEFKKVDSKRGDGDTALEELIWSVHHMMRENPARRFVYGSTLIGRELRSFVGSRIGFFGSEAVDVHKEPKQIIEYYARMMCAADVSLGWDTSMRRNGDGQTVFELKTGENSAPLVLTATRELFSQSAECIRGRATRVFEVTRVKGGAVFALKLGWIEEGRLTEGQIIKTVKESLKEKDPKDQTLEEHVVPVDAEGIVTLPDGVRDTTRLPLGNMDLEGDQSGVVDLPIRASIEQVLSFSGEGKAIEGFQERMTGVPLRPLSNVHREHRWTLYEEVLTPVSELDDMEDVYRALTDAGKGMSGVAKAGWVHRDGSAANFYYGKEKRRGYLSDFEYAVPWSSKRDEQGVRTGTPLFMPFEVATGVWQFGLADKDALAKRRRKQQQEPEEQDLLKKTPEFMATPLHDLESWAWVWLWAVMRFQPAGAAGPTDCQRILSSLLFNGNPGNSSRGSYIRSRNCTVNQNAWSLEDGGGSPEFTVVADIANGVFEAVHIHHQDYQGKWDRTVFERAWKDVLGWCADNTVRESIPIKPWSDNPMLAAPAHRHKRDASQSVTGEAKKRRGQ